MRGVLCKQGRLAIKFVDNFYGLGMLGFSFPPFANGLPMRNTAAISPHDIYSAILFAPAFALSVSPSGQLKAFSRYSIALRNSPALFARRPR